MNLLDRYQIHKDYEVKDIEFSIIDNHDLALFFIAMIQARYIRKEYVKSVKCI
ncbi:MAG: hypothetical protein LBL02_02975 [Endomicrobium sp.]|jgi:hypothetical protein|nr:hypothetical protein [Endomicrobium sp.]